MKSGLQALNRGCCVALFNSSKAKIRHPTISMFSGIVESLGIVRALRKEGENCHIAVECPFTSELKIDQSIAHNGVCLSVVSVNGDHYTVTAIKETLGKTNLG